MATLSFSVESLTPVPVEVYGKGLALVGRTLSSQEMDVEPGSYTVVGRLPDGSRLQVAVDVGKGGSAEAPLQPFPTGGLRDVRAFVRSPVQLFPRDPRGSSIDPAGLPIPDVVELGIPWAPPPATPIPTPGGRVRYWRDPYDGFADSLMLERQHHAVTAVRVPERAFRYYQVSIRMWPDGGSDLIAGLRNELADALLGYMQHGLLNDASVLAGSPELTAESLLERKRGDPVAAAAGAFVLLRLGDLDRLYDWTANLSNWFDWLPDGLVARAEHLAREARHEEARGLLRQLPERGLPSLTAGLAYAADRLRTYVAHWPDDGGLRDALNLVAPYAAVADVHAKVTTFPLQEVRRRRP